MRVILNGTVWFERGKKRERESKRESFHYANVYGGLLGMVWIEVVGKL